MYSGRDAEDYFMHTKFGVPGEAPDSSDELSEEVGSIETDQQRTDRIFSSATPTVDDLTEVLDDGSGGMLEKYLRQYNSHGTVTKIIADNNFDVFRAAVMSGVDVSTKLELLIRAGGNVYAPNGVKKCGCDDDPNSHLQHCATYACTYTPDGNIALENNVKAIRRGMCWAAMMAMAGCLIRGGGEKAIPVLMHSVWSTRTSRDWYDVANPNYQDGSESE